MIKGKEVAKFAAGVTAWESVVHASLWISGSEPVIFGITLTRNVNIIQAIMAGAISIILVSYAWKKKGVIL